MKKEKIENWGKRFDKLTNAIKFEENLKKYFRTYFELANHYETVAYQLERNPLLAIDYLRRAYLISGNKELQVKAKKLHREATLEDRAKNSVEQLLVDF